jgi:hypothetical protein
MDLQPGLTSEIERTVYLQMSEQNSKVPGWLLSTGALRILAILALLRHPDPPPLLVIEEIVRENRLALSDDIWQNKQDQSNLKEFAYDKRRN